MRSEKEILTAINLSCYLIVFGFIECFTVGCSLCAVFIEELLPFVPSNMHERIPVRFLARISTAKLFLIAGRSFYSADEHP